MIRNKKKKRKKTCGPLPQCSHLLQELLLIPRLVLDVLDDNRRILMGLTTGSDSDRD